ncbi:tRNA (N6-isopentenyl adenosine(37)-C2)-methylthiotransferase MiaB [Jiulongibacter sediminis]|uniref:tRNA-2-methylthio-N(6)-dimethylallyladenosine synthase n=1 Tax=Jiulongibacter sediminis TaxID=1605367 RepID=A0A0P7C6J3_9BACT|nr:tRNA (N6-isopentenyl adenosine(37)-C2)-methylthiotransferase MiaB [Jiulongibacter sediminis]KPM49931.1 (dimethylallyl)adenosine tRNA methylthiotransferase [Jiulongibacter sediminis]TBX26967.1 (dimethylallyl)adenosine tRNA methylthiotransferase [Jiulongibacter sediminis]
MEKLTGELKILSEEEKEGLDLARISEDEKAEGKRKLYIESYGCQMNFSDSEIVASILRKEGFATTSNKDEAELILLNTCSIRDNAEQKVRNRLQILNSTKKGKPNVKIGVLGCMAERLKTKLLEEEKMVDMVVGPDSYRDLPNLISDVEDGQKAVNVFLSREETYADITPVRLGTNGVTAFISIMRGCDNMCSFCVVPYTRGRERSREPKTIVQEAQNLFDKGYREVTLLGQNVDSFKWKNENGEIETNFAQLLEMVAQVHPDLRVRFSTSHPKDITDDVLYTIKKYENICNYIHLPAQSGSSRILELMNRTYDREWYIQKIDRIREILGEDCAISHDLITGFCTETEEDHEETLSLMDYVQFDYGYMFYYSERPGTPAAKKLEDDIDLETKKRRLAEIIEKQRGHSMIRNERLLGTVQKALVEGFSKRSEDFLQGRIDDNKVVIFPKENFKKGEYVYVKIEECTTATLKGTAVITEMA